MADETLDDLANAALDGDERALEAARSDPALQRLINEHRQVKQALRAEPTPAAPEDRHRHLEAALAVFDELHRAAEIETKSAGVFHTHPVAPERPRSNIVSLASKRRRKQRWLNVAAAAAVVSVGAIAAVSLSSTGVDLDVGDTAQSGGDSTETTAQASLESTDAAASRATASGAAPLEETLGDAADLEADAPDSAVFSNQDGAESPAADDLAATTSTASSSTATTVAALDAAELGVVFPDGPLDPRFLDCLAEFDVPERPWVVSATVSDTSAALELLVGDDFDTLYRFVFDPSSCLLISPAEPVPTQ